MAREPELSIKVKVDPVIKPDKLKENIEKKITQAKQVPEIEIKPDEDKLVENIQNALKDLPVSVTPKIDAAKLGNDLQNEINKIKELPSVKINVDVDNFSNTLDKKLKAELKEVNEKLSYYLKNLTTNTAGLNSVVEGLFPNRGISNEVHHELKRIQTELTTGLKGTAEKIQPFKVTDLFQVDGKESTITVRRVKQLVTELGESFSSLNNLSLKNGFGDEFDSQFKKTQEKAKELKELLTILKTNLNSEQFKKIFNDDTFDSYKDTKNFSPLIKKLEYIATASASTEDEWDKFIEDIQKGGAKGNHYIDSFCKAAIDDLDSVSQRVSDIIMDQKTAMEVVKEMTKTLDKAIKDDNSGYLSDAEIKTYGAAFDEVLSGIASKQEAINKEREKGVGLENNIVTATRLTRNALSEELTEYEALFKKFDTDKIAKFAETTNLAEFIKNQEAKMQAAQGTGEKNQIENGTYNVTDVKFEIDPAVLQLKVDAAFKDISAPIDLHLKKDAAKHVKDELTTALADFDLSNISKNAEKKEDHTVSVPGKVVITDADVSVDIKKPIQIPGEAVVNKTATIDTSKITTTGEPINIPVKATLKAENIIVPETAIPIKIEAELTGTNVEEATKKPKKNKKATKKSDQQSSVDLTGKIALEPKDITPPETPVELKGHIDLALKDIAVPKKIPLNGELQIANATKEIKEATKKAQSKQPTAKTKNGLTDRDFERRSKELLTSLASIMKGKARVQNSLTNHNRKGQSGAAAEDAGYLTNLSRRERTTKSKLTKLYKGRGGRSAWQNSAIYHSAQEDAAYIRNSRVAENSDKDKVAEEEKYIKALRQRPKLYKDIAAARREYGNDSEYVKSAQKELQETLSIINQFESKVGKQYLQSMPERRKVFAENASNLRKDRDDIRRNNSQTAAKDQQKEAIAAEKAANKERKDSEKEFLDNLAKEPKLWADAEKARKEYGDNSAEVKQAEYLRDRNQSAIKNFKSTYTGSLSDIPGYDDQIKENNFAMATYQSRMTRKANERQQKQHDANQAAFQKRREEAAKQAEDAQKAIEKSSADMVNRVAKSIEENKKIYLDAEKEIIKRQAELLTTEDATIKQNILDKISDAKNLKKTAGNRINSYSDYTGLVQNAWYEINSEKKSYKIDQSLADEKKSNKEISATFDEIIKKYSELDKLKQRRSKLFKPEDVQQLQDIDDKIVKLTDNITDLEIKALDSGIDLHANSDYSNKVAESNKISKESAGAFTDNKRAYDVNAAKESYFANYKDWLQNMDYIDRIDPNSVNAQELISRYQKRADENKQAIDAARKILSINNDISKDAWEEIQRWKDSLSITDAEKAAKAAQKDADKKESNDNSFFKNLQTAVSRKVKAYSDFVNADPGTKDWISKSGKNHIADNDLLDLQNQATANGLKSDVRYASIMDQYRKDIDAVNEAQQKRIDAEADAIKVTDKDIAAVQELVNKFDGYRQTLEKTNKTDLPEYDETIKRRSEATGLLDMLRNDTTGDKNEVARQWAAAFQIKDIETYQDALDRLGLSSKEVNNKIRELAASVVKMNAEMQGRTRVENLKSELSDYLAKFPKVESGLSDEVEKLKTALADPSAYKNASKLGLAMAELKSHAKQLGLESENLLDKFKNLFGQHLSTMITMAALHKMQEALQVVYQNVVEIDTAVTELRKVSEYAGKSLEEYMSRAAEQAQKLGVSISDYINSTADWKRLGYSDEDAENLATYSTLLRNVGDGIDDVNTSSSYLISTLKGFGLLADQAEDVVNKIDAVANTQPVTANDLGEILTRSSAAMSAANNTLEETIALGTAANAVIQDADTVGTTLKSLSMYLRAAKTDAENAGIEVDGMANSVSELRSELKSLTGVDVMLDSKNFKSTYQIMKELSQVWGNLSDVTQANVTELIGGKRNANAVSAILNNFSVAESAMESAANSANVAWEENEKYLDSIQGRLAQLDASFQALSTDILSSDLVKTGVSFLTTVVKLIDKLVNLTGALPLGLGIGAFATQLGKPKMTGFMIVPSNTPGGDTEQVLRRYSIISMRSMREYLAKPTNMAA